MRGLARHVVHYIYVSVIFIFVIDAQLEFVSFPLSTTLSIRCEKADKTFEGIDRGGGKSRLPCQCLQTLHTFIDMAGHS